jgi:hypothetical protein
MVLVACVKCFNWPRKLAKLLSLILALEIASLDAEIIPSSRRIDWSAGKTVGVPGGIPNRTMALTQLALWTQQQPSKTQ